MPDSHAETRHGQSEPAERLHQRWREGQRPDVDAFLAQVGPLSPAQVAAVLRVDQRERWRHGERVAAEDYLTRHPAVAASPEAAIDLVFNEFLLREQLGERPPAAEYLGRFPGYADTLQAQIELHHALAESGGAATLSAGAVPPAPAWPAVPGYEILGELGRGAMGVVYRARHRRLNRVVALKMILAGEQAGPEQRIRFLQEAELLARLHHPHIVMVHETGTHQGCPYLALEFIDGPSLAEKCRTSPLPPPQAARLVETLARTIHEAHRQGVIHRDLKPANVLLAGGDVPKITDFGLARRAELDQGLTQTGAILGTPAYMAPEQAEGKKGVGPPADVYALGAILYELLTGRVPFCGQTVVETMHLVLNEPPIPVRRLAPAVPDDLETITLKCLNKEPSQRYASAQALAEDLRRHRAGEPIAARPAGKLERAWRWARRHPGWAAALTVAVTSLLLLAAGSTLAAVWFADERSRALGAEKEANEQREAALANLRRAEQAERDQREKLWQSYLSEARARRYSRRVGQRYEGLAALEKAARIRPDARLRDLAITALALPDVRFVRPAADFPAGLQNMVFDANYRLYAHAAGKDGILVRRVTDHQVVHRLTDQAGRGLGTFSPDGRFLAVAGADGNLRVRRLADGRLLASAPFATHLSLAFRPDGRQLAVAGPDSVVVFDLETGKERKRFPLPAPAYQLAWGAGGRLAVGHTVGSTTRVYDAATGELLVALPVGPMSEQVVAWHPDGERLAVGGGDNPALLQIWDVAAGRRVANLDGHAQNVTMLTFHPGGGLLASTSWDGTVRLWEPGTGREVLQMNANNLRSNLRFSADGRWLACVVEGGKDGLLEVASGRAYRTLVSRLGAGQGGYNQGDFSPDGRLLAVGMNEGARVWDLPTGREVAALPTQTNSPHFHLTSPGALLTAGAKGLHRWPLQPTRGAGEPGRLGPPRHLSGFRYASARQDRRAILGVTDKLLWTLDVDSGKARQVAIDHPGVSDQPALSPDGRLAATWGWHSVSVKVWDVRTGKLVRDLPLPRARVAFTPDGRHLIASRDDELAFYDVASWQVVRRVRRAVAGHPGQVAFSPDGKLMALPIEPAVIRLEELATGRTVATLEDPFGDRVTWIGFSPDGSQLGVVANYNRCVHVWDLRLLREELKAVGLDWDWPALRPAPPPADPPRFVVDAGSLGTAFAFRQGEPPRQTVERATAALRGNPNDVEAYHYRGHAWEKLLDFHRAVGDFTEAHRRRPDDAHLLACRGTDRLRLRQYAEGIADLERALTLKPVPAEAAAVCDRLAWLRVAGPPSLRDARKALPLAERAVQLQAENANYHRTLALASYRLGRLDEARRAAQTSDARTRQPSALTAYIQAMILHGLADAGAKTLFLQGEARRRQSWRSLNPEQKAALRSVRNEASGLAPPAP